MRTARPQAGFTIIEMMIAMTILAFISLAVYQNTTQSFVLRDNVEQDGDFYNSIRVALDVMGRDVVHLYSPQSEALPGTLGKASQTPPPGVQPGFNDSSHPATPFWNEPINSEGVRPSRFRGETGMIAFVTNSHFRLFRDTPESDFAKITYLLEEDKLEGPGAKGKSLIKREDPLAFIDDKKNPETEVRYVLMGGIKSLEFEFLDGEKDHWEKRWDTAGMEHKNVFPAIIRVIVEVYMPKSDSTFKITQDFRPELPI